MTTQRVFKSKVRARASKTGEAYTAARRALIAKADHRNAQATPGPSPSPSPEFKPTVSGDALRTATGRDWHEWFGILDAWGGSEHKHAEIARWVHSEHGVDGWWAQNITVGYEQARGLRRVHQRPDGFEISASKTVSGTVEQLYDTFADPALRERWLPGADLIPRARAMHRGKSARFDWNGGPSVLVVGFLEKPGGKAQAALAHQRLPDAKSAETMKAYWRAAMLRLAKLLAQSSTPMG